MIHKKQKKYFISKLFPYSMESSLTTMIGILFCLYSLIVILIFFLLYKNLMLQHCENSICRDSQSIAHYIEAEFSEGNFEKGRTNIQEKLQNNFIFFEDLVQAEVWIADQKNHIYIYQNEKVNTITDKETPPFINKMMEMILSGKKACKKEKVDGEVMLAGGAPIKDENRNVSGAVLLYSSFDEMTEEACEGYSVLFITLVLSLLLILGAVVVFARCFVRPIKQIQTYALTLANQNYEKKTNIQRKDEIGQLAEAMELLAEQLEEARIASEKTEREKQEFLSKISHELKTPVTVIRASLELLEDDVVKSEEEKQEYIHQMIVESIWLQKLISDLLDLTRLQAKDYKMKFEKVSMTELLGDVLMSARTLAGKKKIAVDCKVPDREVFIWADYDRIRQLLMIFIDNAVKYSAWNSQININLDTEENRIWVEDQVIGIEKENLKYIFNPYYSSRNKMTDSTGLGLVIAHEIAEKHHYEIEVKSKVDEGTKISLKYSPYDKNK